MKKVAMKKVGTSLKRPATAVSMPPKKRPAGSADLLTMKSLLRAPEVKAAIMKGFIKITGEDKKELKQVVLSGEWWLCGHILKATLKDLLEQSDYAGTCNLENAPVLCKRKKCAEEEGRAYVTGMCEGKPSFDTGTSHSHCWKCPRFGQCIGVYREVHCDGCGKQYFGGSYEANYCSCKKGREEKKEFGNGGTDESG